MGQARVDRLREEYEGLEVEWRAFELHPGIPPEGQPVPFSPERIAEGRARFAKLAEEAGLEHGERTHWYDSKPAHEAVQWAAERGQADAFKRAVFRAYFVENRNIGSADVLAELADGLGLDGGDLTRALEEGRYRAEVEAQYEEAPQIGVTAVPTFVVNGYALIGAHPLENLRKLIEAGRRSPG